jgi:hypothetical protein
LYLLSHDVTRRASLWCPDYMRMPRVMLIISANPCDAPMSVWAEVCHSGICTARGTCTASSICTAGRMLLLLEEPTGTCVRGVHRHSQ